MKKILSKILAAIGLNESREMAVVSFLTALGGTAVGGLTSGVIVAILISLFIAVFGFMKYNMNPVKLFIPTVLSGLFGVVASGLLLFAFSI